MKLTWAMAVVACLSSAPSLRAAGPEADPVRPSASATPAPGPSAEPSAAPESEPEPEAQPPALGRDRDRNEWRRSHRRKDRVYIAQAASVAAGETVEGSVVVIGSHVEVAGTVTDDVVCIGGSARLHDTARVQGDVVTIGGVTQVDPAAVIRGNQVNIASFPFVLGDARWGSLDPWSSRIGPWSRMGLRLARFAFSLGFFLFLVLVGSLVTALAPAYLDRLGGGLLGSFPRAALLGAAAMILLPVVSLLLAATCVGLPLIPLLWLGLGLAALVGYVAVAWVVGQRFLPGHPRWLQIAFGVLILDAATLLGHVISLGGGLLGLVGMALRLLGTIVFVAASFVGLGAVLARWAARDGERPADRPSGSEPLTRA